MLTPNLPEPELLKAILQPLLDDFLYWFDRSRRLLQTEDVSFLTAEEKDDLLARIDPVSYTHLTLPTNREV